MRNKPSTNSKAQSSKLKLRGFGFCIALALGFWFLKFLPALAAAPSGITVSPAFQMVSIPTGASQEPVSFTITNDQPTAQSLSLSVTDFNTLNESGGLFFVGTNPTALQKQYGLAKWVSLPTTNITIQPRQTYKLQAMILNLPTLAGGGHYGALMISLDNNAQPSANNPVGLHPIASSLLFVTKLDGAAYGLDLSGVSFKHSLFSLPSSLTLRFQNTGNTHLVPRGEVTITGSNNRLIDKGIINENSNVILPQAYRLYTVGLHRIASSSSIDKYSLRVDFRFDGLNQFRSYKTSFWVVPAYIATLLVGLVLLISLVLVVTRKRRWRKKISKIIIRR